MKILHRRTGGFILYYKRLEKGTFEVPSYDKSVKTIQLNYPQLVLLFDGITIENLTQKKQQNPSKTFVITKIYRILVVYE